MDIKAHVRNEKEMDERGMWVERYGEVLQEVGIFLENGTMKEI